MQKCEQPKCDSCGAYLPLSDALTVKCEYCGVEATLRSTASPPPPRPIEAARKGSAAPLVAVSVFVSLAALATIIAVIAEPSTNEPNATTFVPSGALRASPSTRIEISPLLIEVRSSDGPHYLKAGAAFELSNGEAVRLFERRSDLVRDAVKMILSEQSFERLSDPTTKPWLLEEFKKSLDMTLGEGMVKDAEFTSFALQ